MIGVCGLGAEVAKNIVLAGVQEVTVLDHTSLKTDDSACRFLMQADGVNVCLNLISSLCVQHDEHSHLSREQSRLCRGCEL